MKKLTFVFTALFALSLVSCQDLQDAFKVFNFSSFGVPITSLTVPSDELSVGFDLDSQLPWQVLSQPDWIGITPADGGRGRVTITVTPHGETDTPRSGVITFRASDGSKIDLPVSQYPFSTLFITDIKSPNQESLSADALSTALDLTKGLTYIGELEPYAFIITSNTAWTVTCPSWSEIDITASTIATGSFTLANNAITGGNGNATLVVRPKKNGLSDLSAAGFDPNTPITKTGSETANQLALTYQKDGSAQTVQVSLNVRMPIALVYIPADTFWMGSSTNSSGQNYALNTVDNEKPAHSVTLSKSFYMGKYELTQEQWLTVVGTNPSHFKDGQGGVTDGSAHPVEMVSWAAIAGFMSKVNATGSSYYQEGKAYRLPTEAEWEYACRAGMSTPFGIGTGKVLNGDLANIDGQYAYDLDNGGAQDLGNGNGTYLGHTTPSGNYKDYGNAWGLYDMHGNVWEWCHDGLRPYDISLATDPTGSTSAGDSRVLRGGSWDFSARHCRSAYRRSGNPGLAINYVGFRVVLVP